MRTIKAKEKVKKQNKHKKINKIGQQKIKIKSQINIKIERLIIKKKTKKRKKKQEMEKKKLKKP